MSATPHAPMPHPNLARAWSGRVAPAQMRAANMGLLLRHLRATGPRSRASLAHETGLSKATTSGLIADLIAWGLVREDGLVHDGTVGRPALSVMLDGTTVTGIGLEINDAYVAVTAVSLAGTVVRESLAPLDTPHLDIDAVLDRLARILTRTVTSLRESHSRVVGVTIVPPGVIDYATGAVRFAPNLGWREIPLVSELSSRLDPQFPPLRLENDAKAAAVAEFDNHANRGVSDLLYLAGEAGVGVGIIAEGRLIRGWSGFSGEVGHLPLDRRMRLCKCGRRGCWELAVGLPEFLDLALSSDDPLHDASQPLDDRLAALADRADAGDAQTLSALGSITDHLADGLSTLVDVLNPRVIVLGGYFTYFADHLIPPLSAALESRRMAEGSSVELAAARFGQLGAARGGAKLALEDVFVDPTALTLSA